MLLDEACAVHQVVALAASIAKAICLCATPNDGHPNAIAPVTNTKDGWIAVLADELDAGEAAKDAVEDTAVVHSCYAARLVRQHRREGSPFVVGKLVAHDSKLPVWELESQACRPPNCAFYLSRVRFRGEAAIDQRARLIGVVENGPRRTSKSS
jgi:hypothetical protein